jgi:hypothetical protein
MATRPTKRSIAAPTRPTRPTRRGVAIQADDDEPEPFFSSRPTRREVITPELIPPRKEKVTNIRGQFSISSVRNVGANTISGEIAPIRKRSPTRSQPPPMAHVKLVSSTKKTITLEIHGKELTLDRQAAIELASTIFTTFGPSS